MSKQVTAIAGLLVIAITVFLAGCTTTPSAIPTLTITAPQDGASASQGNITVSVQVSNFTLVDRLGQANAAGEGHIHYYMDVPVPTTAGQPALSTPGHYAPTAATTYTWTNVSAGTHNFSAQLVNNDHSPVIPLVSDTVTVTISAPVAVPQVQILSPGDAAVVSPGNLTVTVRASNITLVQKLGQTNVAGEGHLHYYLDVPVPSTPGQPALSTPGQYAPTAATSYTWTNLTAGTHNLSVQVVNNDHTPVIPLVFDTVIVNVAAPTPTPTAVTTTTVATTVTTRSGSSGY